jgi:hypothetical protein
MGKCFTESPNCMIEPDQAKKYPPPISLDTKMINPQEIFDGVIFSSQARYFHTWGQI